MRRLSRRVLFTVVALLAAASAAFAQDDTVRVVSPDGQIEFRVFITKPPDGSLLRLAYQVSYRGKLLMDTSLMGFVIHDFEPLLGENIGLTASKTESVNETYTDPADQRKTIRNHYNGLIAQFLQNGSVGCPDHGGGPRVR